MSAARAPGEPPDVPPANFQARLAERLLGRQLEDNAVAKGRRTKTAQLTALGWRILPIPSFCRARELWHDDAGNGNPAMIDFGFVLEWLVIAPEDFDLPAQKIRGRIRAIRWAYDKAMAARPMDDAK